MKKISLILMLLTLSVQGFAQNNDSACYDKITPEVRRYTKELVLRLNDYVALMTNEGVSHTDRMKARADALHLFEGEGMPFCTVDNNEDVAIVDVTRIINGRTVVYRKNVRDYFYNLAEDGLPYHQSIQVVGCDIYVPDKTSMRKVNDSLYIVDYECYNYVNDRICYRGKTIKYVFPQIGSYCRDLFVTLGNVKIVEYRPGDDVQASVRVVDSVKLRHDQAIRSFKQGANNLIYMLKSYIIDIMDKNLSDEQRMESIEKGISLFVGRGDRCVVDNEIMVAKIRVDSLLLPPKAFFDHIETMCNDTMDYTFDIDGELYLLSPSDVEKVGEETYLCKYKCYKSASDIESDVFESKHVYSLHNPCIKDSTGKEDVCAVFGNIRVDIQKQSNSNVDVFFIVEDMPEFAGGELALRRYIDEHLVYPEEAKAQNIQGTVYVRFVINELGKVTNVEVIRGVDHLLDAEAIRVIRTLPPWKPGKQRGKTVKCSHSVPVRFRLDDSKTANGKAKIEKNNTEK